MNVFSRFSRRMDAYKIYLILTFFSQLFFSIAFSVNLLYHINVAKLNPLQLVLVGTVLELAVFVFEIPTGIVADRVSRKLSIIIGYSLIGVGFLVEGLFPSFLPILLAQIMWGIGYTFTSGATQAWITDEIGEAKAGKAFLTGAQFGNIGEFIALPIGVCIGLVSLNLPIIYGGLFMLLLGIILIIIMPETRYTPSSENSHQPWFNVLNTVKDIKVLVRLQPIVLYLLLIGLFYGLYSEGFDRLYTKYFTDFFNIEFWGMKPVVFLGVLSGVKMVLNIGVLGVLNRKSDVENNKTVIRILIFSTFLIVISLLAFGITNILWIAIILYLVIGISRNITAPFMDIWLNSMIENPNTRATMFSVKGQVDAVGQIGGGPVLGFIGGLFSVRIALIASGVVLSPILLLYRRLLNKMDKNRAI